MTRRQRGVRALAGCAAVAALAGCRAATRVTEVPRVDLDLAGGNRGYFAGTPPEPGPMKTTRTMVQTDVEIPSFYAPTPGHRPVDVGTLAPPEIDTDEAPPPGRAPARHDAYVVQKGESLWSIAAKPEVYGKATHWRRIYDANRGLLKSPDKVRAGMTLKIPRDDGDKKTVYGDEGLTYKK